MKSTSKCFSAHSLLATSSWRASDLRLLDSMIVCILSVPVTLSSFLLPFSLQKMQHLSILQLYLHRTKQKMHILQKILVWTLLKRLNLILYSSKHWDSHQNYFDTLYNFRDIDENKIFSNGGLNLHIVRIAQICQSGIIQILQRYRNSIKTLYGPYCKVLQKYGVWQPDYIKCM